MLLTVKMGVDATLGPVERIGNDSLNARNCLDFFYQEGAILNQQSIDSASQLEDELRCFDSVRKGDFRMVRSRAGSLEALMRAGAFECAIRSHEVSARTQVAGAKNKFNQLANRGGNDPFFRRSRCIC